MNMRSFGIFCAVGLLLIMALLFYIVFENQKELTRSVATLSVVMRQDCKQKQEIQVVEKVVVQQPWGAVQTQVKDTVVQIIAQTAEINILKPYETPRQGGGFGSGFFISEKGEIITNMHVIDQAQSVWIKIPSLGKAIIPVEVVGKAPERDLALLRVTQEGMEIIRRELGEFGSY